jgi:hypothetical protein
MTKFEDDGLPVLLGIPHGNQYAVWCPYCRRMHYHGRIPGHRSAHCEAGPFYARGYYLMDGSQELRKSTEGRAGMRLCNWCRRPASFYSPSTGKAICKGCLADPVPIDERIMEKCGFGRFDRKVFCKEVDSK